MSAERFCVSLRPDRRTIRPPFIPFAIMQSEHPSEHGRIHARHRPPVIHQVPPTRVFTWLREGWHMFVERPADWILMALGAFFLLALSTLCVPIPLIGPLMPPLLMTLLLAGMLHAVHLQAQKHTLAFRLLFEGFRRHPGNLTMIGVFYALPLVLMHLLTMLALGGGLLVGLLGWSLGTTVNQLAAGVISFLAGLGVLWILFLMLWGLLLLAMLFAPALVMLDDYPPLDAMRYSLRASLNSLGAIVLLAVCLYVLFVVALIPVGLGVLIYIPVVVGSLHAAYRDILAAPALPPVVEKN